ncbi:TPA: phage protein [Salmonella enterica subsp. diarizonae serovar 61:r:z53]
MGSTYSFMDVTASLSGPTGEIDLGYGSASSEEGITVAMGGPKNTMTIGADGEVMHSLHEDKSGTVTVNLLKTSPTNKKLSLAYNAQSQSSGTWGNNVIVIRNTSLSDETYRIVLKTKIAINNWDGRNDSLPPILDAALDGSGLKMQIVDNQDMTIGIWVFPETDISSVSLELIAAIRQGYLTVKAAGVWGGSIEIPSVETPSEGNRFFGFDMDNEYISGFDAGSWGTLL